MRTWALPTLDDKKLWVSPLSSVTWGDRTRRGLSPFPALTPPSAPQGMPPFHPAPHRPATRPSPVQRPGVSAAWLWMYSAPVPQWVENAEVALLWMNIEQKPQGGGFREKSLWWPKPRALQGLQPFIQKSAGLPALGSRPPGALRSQVPQGQANRARTATKWACLLPSPAATNLVERAECGRNSASDMGANTYGKGSPRSVRGQAEGGGRAPSN